MMPYLECISHGEMMIYGNVQERKKVIDD
jgi:hypothetical protein